MKLIIVHHHFRPGGVRRVIELATPHLVAHWPERIGEVVLASGEAPDPAWLEAFRQRLDPTPVRVLVLPALGYVSELGLEGKSLARRIARDTWQVVKETNHEAGLIWAHNLGLGRNLYLARELTLFCRARGIPLMAQHHDWWFENRWHHYAAMRKLGFQRLSGVTAAVLAESNHICHVAINQADAAVLKAHFPGLSGWLPNLVEPASAPPAGRVAAARAWLSEQLGENAPVWLLPCRLLRRKNIAEALLLTRWLRPEAWLVTTGGVSSAEELAYADTLAATAQARGWRLKLGILQGDETRKPSVPELLAAAEAVLLTSLQEGFGLPFLEAAAARRPLVARELPNIAPDLAKFRFRFPQCYRELLVDPALFDWHGERERQARAFAAWKRLMPRAASRFVGKPALLAAGRVPCPVSFCRLTLTAQLEVLAWPIEQSFTRCAPLNPFLWVWREWASAGRLKTSRWPLSAERWLSGRAYAQRFLELVPHCLPRDMRPGAGKAAQTDFFRQKLRSENLYPLLWDSRS